MSKLSKQLSYFLIALFLVLAGCESFAFRARDGIAGAKGFIEKAQRNHLSECQSAPDKPLCVAINKAVDAQNLAIDSLILYCGSNEFVNGGASCQPNKEVEPRVREALSRLDQVVAELKGVLP